MTPFEAFRDQIEKHLAATGITASAFGRAAIGDPNFVSDLRTGRMPSLRTVGRVEAYIRESSPPHEVAE